jgi:hypothetical protein
VRQRFLATKRTNKYSSALNMVSTINQTCCQHGPTKKIAVIGEEFIVTSMVESQTSASLVPPMNSFFYGNNSAYLQSNNDFKAIHSSLDCQNLSLVNSPHGNRNFSNIVHLDLPYNENLVIDDLRWLFRLSSSLQFLDLSILIFTKKLIGFRYWQCFLHFLSYIWLVAYLTPWAHLFNMPISLHLNILIFLSMISSLNCLFGYSI